MTNQRILDTLMARLASVENSSEEALSDAIDSLTFIDLFLDIERENDTAIALDDVVACKTVGDLYALLDGARTKLNQSREVKR